MRYLPSTLVLVAAFAFVGCENQPYEVEDPTDAVYAKGGTPGKPGGGGEDPPPVDPEIVFVGWTGGPFGVAGMAADGSGSSLIWRCKDSCWRPSWSPDGQKIVFDMWDRKNTSTNLWIVNTDGSGLFQLTTYDGYETNADWSPDGSQLAFSLRDGVGYNIGIIDPDGSSLRVIEPPPGFRDDDPAWSPDGTRIAFVREAEEPAHAPSAVFVMDVDGSNVQEVTPPAPMLSNGYPEYTDSDPAWSPDGTLIAFDRLIEVEGTYRVFAVRPDGTGLVNLTPDLDHWATDPSWSPDGTRIVFDGGNISTMKADGSDVTVIVPADETGSDPDWRP